MQVIFVRSRHRLPRISAKIRAVIARLPAVFFLHKVEVICIFAIRICQRLFEPFMLVGTVVHHQIHHNVHASLFCLGKQLVKLLHRSEFLRDRVVVGNVIPLIHKGRFINRREPDDVNAKLFQIVQLRDNSPQIPDSVPVRIQKALRINLINNCFFPPCFLHLFSPYKSAVMISMTASLISFFKFVVSSSPKISARFFPLLKSRYADSFARLLSCA